MTTPKIRDGLLDVWAVWFRRYTCFLFRHTWIDVGFIESIGRQARVCRICGKPDGSDLTNAIHEYFGADGPFGPAALRAQRLKAKRQRRRFPKAQTVNK